MSKWIPAWRYVPINYGHDMGSFENITQKCVLTNNLAGEQLRLRFNNLYGEVPMVIDHAMVALHNRQTGVTTPRMPVTLNGQEKIVVPAASRPYSDPVNLTITAQDDILVDMYFGEKTVFRTVVTTSTGIGWQSTHHTGDFTKTRALGYTMKSQLAPVLANDPNPPHFAVGLCEVSVLTGDDVKLLALFGDSITHMSLFMDPLIARLYELMPGKISVMNAGIAGNRVQKTYPKCVGFPGEGAQFGIAGKDRFYADVYDGAQPDLVFVMEGVNDCSHSLCFNEQDVPTSQVIFDALADVVNQAHAQGSKVLLSTISPFGAFGDSWRSAAEALRCGTNELIRSSTIADGIVDMDAANRDPEDIHRMQDGLHMGDGVHPNWHGGTNMAKTLLKKLADDNLI